MRTEMYTVESTGSLKYHPRGSEEHVQYLESKVSFAESERDNALEKVNRLEAELAKKDGKIELYKKQRSEYLEIMAKFEDEKSEFTKLKEECVLLKEDLMRRNREYQEDAVEMMNLRSAVGVLADMLHASKLAINSRDRELMGGRRTENDQP